MKGYSQQAIDWLKSIELAENIIIQCATSPKGEFKIKSPNGRFYRADGYHEESNTVYEYYGDYWHGNPQKFHPDDINQSVGKTFGELYKNTIEREEHIRSMGYKVIAKWENSSRKNLDNNVDVDDRMGKEVKNPTRTRKIIVIKSGKIISIRDVL